MAGSPSGAGDERKCTAPRLFCKSLYQAGTRISRLVCDLKADGLSNGHERLKWVARGRLITSAYLTAHEVLL